MYSSVAAAQQADPVGRAEWDCAAASRAQKKVYTSFFLLHLLAQGYSLREGLVSDSYLGKRVKAGIKENSNRRAYGICTSLRSVYNFVAVLFYTFPKYESSPTHPAVPFGFVSDSLLFIKRYAQARICDRRALHIFQAVFNVRQSSFLREKKCCGSFRRCYYTFCWFPRLQERNLF